MYYTLYILSDTHCVYVSNRWDHVIIEIIADDTHGIVVIRYFSTSFITSETFCLSY